MQSSESLAALGAALSKAQGEMPVAVFDKQNHNKGGYATLGALITASRATLAKYGLSVVQLPTNGPDGGIGVVTMLLHESGEWISEPMCLPVDSKMPQNGAQAAGATITYFRRYGLAAVLGLYADEDNDGENHSQPRNAAQSGAQCPPQREQQPLPPQIASTAQQNKIAALARAKWGDDWNAHLLGWQKRPLSDFSAPQANFVIGKLSEQVAAKNEPQDAPLAVA